MSNQNPRQAPPGPPNTITNATRFTTLLPAHSVRTPSPVSSSAGHNQRHAAVGILNHSRQPSALTAAGPLTGTAPRHRPLLTPATGMHDQRQSSARINTRNSAALRQTASSMVTSALNMSAGATPRQRPPLLVPTTAALNNSRVSSLISSLSSAPTASSSRHPSLGHPPSVSGARQASLPVPSMVSISSFIQAPSLVPSGVVLNNPRPDVAVVPGGEAEPSVSTPPVVRKAVKRSAPTLPVTNGDVKTWEEKSNDLLCPICFDVFKEAHITQCGHSYCYDCICTTIDQTSKCPRCGVMITKDQLIPNFSLSQLVAQQKTTKTANKEIKEAGKCPSFTGPQVFKFLGSNYHDLSLGDVNVLLTLLSRKKEVLTTQDSSHQKTLTMEFLTELLKIKNSEKAKLDREVNLISHDLAKVSSTPVPLVSPNHEVDSCSSPDEVPSSSAKFARFSTTVKDCAELEEASIAARKSRIFSHFDELSTIYLESRRSEIFEEPSDISDPSIPTEEDKLTEDDILSDFSNSLANISRYHALKPLATLSYNADLLSNSNIVSSIEFDKDNEFFAIAGVTKKIKLFEYANVLGASVDIHYPSAELLCNAKISCVAWSGYYKNNLASSDYDGCVNLWDTGNTTKIRSLNEHEKRVWSVDWSNGDPRLLASGSDDAKVKLWAMNQEKAVITLDAKANVCCVKYCPENSFVLAFGSADHCVHYYDFRHIREPLGILYGHKKAVSYVKFASKSELVSASTDSNLKLWNLESMENVRSFRGHINEKNFVGLATDGNFIACGSENNSLYVYYKSLPKPLFSFKFDTHRSMLEKPKTDESTEFVSAVAWKKGSPVVVAANSQGAIKLLEMI